MWTVIYIAQSEKLADKIRESLMEDGFLVRVKPLRMTKQQFEILVPASELEEVQEALSQILHR